MDRRDAIKAGIAGAFSLWTAPLLQAGVAGRDPRSGPGLGDPQVGPGSRPNGSIRKLSDRLSVLDAGGTNVVALSASDGLTLVDTGMPGSGDRLMADLKGLGGNGKVQTVFNTHYHLPETANNGAFAASGATFVAPGRTRQWMSIDHWLPDANRYEKARPKATWPTEVFFNGGSRKVGGEQIDYGYLMVAHTAGDIYVHFRDSNVLAVGDIASPVNDPELDWITGAWIGGRVSAMDALLKIGNDQTRVVPGTGPVMTWAEFKAERELMETVRQRLFKQIRQGDGPQDMVDGGVLNGLPRTWKDPYKFLYAAARGLWGNHNKLDPDVV
jgi:glyoxylase-like metal-dependent hydrolase (beta-lactamase superfamily II)